MLFSFNRVYSVAKKEYLEIRRDKLYILMAFLCPVLLFLPFAYGLRLDVEDIKLGVCDMDNSPQSRDFIEAFMNTGYFNLEKYTIEYDIMEDELERGSVKVVVVIPANFSRDLNNGRSPDIQVILDASDPGRADTAGGYIQGIVADFDMKIFKEYINYYGAEGASFNIPVETYTKIWFNDTLDSRNFIVPPLIAVILYFFPPMITSLTITKEKEMGSIKKFYCSPVTSAEYVIGKMIPYSVITYLNFCILFIMVRLLFPSVPFRGNVVLLFIISIFYCIATTGIGMIIYVLMKSQVAAIIVAFVFTMIPSFMYSGMFFSPASMGPDAAIMSSIIPVSYFISIIRQFFLKAGGIHYYIFDFIIIILFSLLYPILSIFLLKKKL